MTDNDIIASTGPAADATAPESLAALQRERANLLKKLSDLTEACNHLLNVGEFCRTDDTESALRRLRAVLSAHQIDPLELAIAEAIGMFVLPGAPWKEVRAAISRRGGVVTFPGQPTDVSPA